MKTIKNLLATAVLLLCSVVAMAQTTATVDGITYEFITKAKLATVVTSESGSYTGNIVILKSVEYSGVCAYEGIFHIHRRAVDVVFLERHDGNIG